MARKKTRPAPRHSLLKFDVRKVSTSFLICALNYNRRDLFLYLPSRVLDKMNSDEAVQAVRDALDDIAEEINRRIPVPVRTDGKREG